MSSQEAGFPGALAKAETESRRDCELMATNTLNQQAAGNVEELTAENVRAIAALDAEAQKHVSTADRIAAHITRFCGSMAFVWVHVAWFTVWIIWNTMLPTKIDPYPFSFLTLVVSLEAIFLSTFIMIAENRQERVDERRSHLDLQINLLSEQENTKMLDLLSKIADKLGIDPSGDPTVEVLKQATRPEALVAQIDDIIAEGEKNEASKPRDSSGS